MSHNHREIGEQRILAASTVIARKSRGGGIKFLLLAEIPKIEVTAGFNRWRNSKENSWSFPGGGRSVNENGYSETLQETLKNETSEEMRLDLSLAFLNTGIVQAVPFIVGQKSDNSINQIGVTSALYWFDKLNLDEKTTINNREEEKIVKWFNLKYLVELYVYANKNQSKIDSLGFRPHAFTTAFLWHLNLVQNESIENVRFIVNTLNKFTRQFLTSESRQLNIPIKNGAFSDSGEVLLPNELNLADANFLYGQKEKRRIN
jgi:8-oxo-dGTP pyrophosphatase MutT (NUDIX family)